MIVFNTYSYYSDVKIILIITITKVRMIICLLMVVKITVNHAIFNVRKNKFMFFCFKQFVINYNIFL